MKYIFFTLLLLPFSCNSQNADRSIILINAGTRGRGALADLIERVNELRPKVIAIDFQFKSEGNPEVDNKLIAALDKCENLVMVSVIADYSPNRLFHDRFILGCLPKFTRNASTGFVNLIADGDDSLTVRRFSLLQYVDGREEFSFALRTAYQFDSTRARSFRLTHTNFNNINFDKGLFHFKRFSIEDFLGGRVDREDINGKIVMIGFLGPGNEDKFIAPITESMEPNIYGLEFHAQVVSQILHE